MRKSVPYLPFSRFLSVHMIGYYGKNDVVYFETDVSHRDFEYTDHEVKFFSFGVDSAEKFASIASFTISPCLMLTTDHQVYIGVLNCNNAEIRDNSNPLSLRKADRVNAPFYEEMPIVIECKKTRIEEMNILGAYVYADIENISVSPTIMNDDGTVNIQKMLSAIHFVKVRD